MKKDRVFKEFIAVIDLSRIGYQGKAFLMITTAPNQDKSETIKSLTKIKNIISVTEIIGAFDILAIAPISDLDNVMNLIRKVKELPSVQQVELSITKDTAFPISSDFSKTVTEKFLKQVTTQ